MDRICVNSCWNHIMIIIRWLKHMVSHADSFHHYIIWASFLQCPLSHLGVNEDDFSVPVECHRFFKSHDITFHVSFHWHIKCHKEKLEFVVVMITCSRIAGIARHQLQIKSLIPLVFTCQYYPLMCHHGTHNQISKKNIWLLPSQKKSFQLTPGRNHAMV